MDIGILKEIRDEKNRDEQRFSEKEKKIAPITAFICAAAGWVFFVVTAVAFAVTCLVKGVRAGTTGVRSGSGGSDHVHAAEKNMYKKKKKKVFRQ